MEKTRCPSEKHYENSFYRPTVEGIIINGKRGRLLSVLYGAAGAGLHPVVLLLHGIPGCEQNGDIAQALRRCGFHVLTFHYSGCFGSDGDYALANNIEDADTVLDFILNDTQYNFDKSNIFAVGHSMGGFVCAQLSAARREIKGAALLMLCNIGRLSKIREENLSAYKTIIRILEESSKWLRNADIEKFLSELELYEEQFALENLSESLGKKPLLCVSADLDTHTPPKYHCLPLENALLTQPEHRVKSVHFNTDHFASDYRLELLHEIIDFFSTLI